MTALLDAVPALGALARIEAEQVAQVDSKDMSFALWSRLVERVAFWSAQSDVSGIVITHGTDTLEETAMLLHLACVSTVPVVLTAAMRPSTSLSADGPLNLLKGALLVINQEIHAGRDVVKAHTSAVNAFVSPVAGPIGYVQDDFVRFVRTPGRLPVSAWSVPSAWPQVEILASYAEPGRIVVDALAQAGVSGLVVAAAGNGSVHQSLVEALVDAAGAGVAVVRSSRTGAGHVAIPASPRPASGVFVSAGDLNPYKARVLLALALAVEPGLAKDPVALQALFAEN
ncbi:periplasmic L-asparaginase II [Cupriavidus basilensis OR16]|uniref:Periplasmic L-asparaginase II n=1 Tax=Cupriavidus basilensis OR16 TaxID=1127483 RepID=H1SGR5_9BURK|nr:periplasmic L-asparaginase II [Cupriavidus basilensis OR16]